MSPEDFNALCEAVVAAESSGNPRAVSAMGAKGLYQLMDATGREWHERLSIQGQYDPFNAEQNAQIGRAYLRWLLTKFDGNLRLALAAFNFGIGNVGRLLKAHTGSSYERLTPALPPETRNYVAKVEAKFNEIRGAHGTVA